MRKIKILIVSVILLTICPFTFSQENEKIIIGEKVTFISDILGHERDIYIYLPPDYELYGQTYPVIYTTDAENSFSLMTSVADIFPKSGIMPAAIIIGIVNRGEQERYYDFAPVIKDKPESGRADVFTVFLEKELFPFVEQNYRTQPFRILFGHSFLGMFTTHVLLTNPGLFQGYIISSPDLRWISEEIQDAQITGFSRPTFLYVSKGSDEGQSKEIEAFVNLMKAVDNLNFSFVENAGENHQSNGVISIINGLRFIYADWRLPKPPKRCSPSEISDHYKKLSLKYGYEIPNPYFATEKNE